jgi:hypothetical protein
LKQALPALVSLSALLFLLGLDAVVDFFAMHRDFLGRVYANADLITLDSKYGNLNLVADHDGFANPTR